MCIVGILQETLGRQQCRTGVGNLSVVLCRSTSNVAKSLSVQTHPSPPYFYIQGGSNMTGTDLYVNKPHCAAAVRP